MEEKFNKLDNFLREHLHDASENQAWNVPDDAIFDKAMRTVAEGKKNKRRGWILLPLMLLSGLVVNEYLHNRHIKTLEGKITHLEDSLSAESQSIDAPALLSQNTPADKVSSLNTPSESGSAVKESTSYTSAMNTISNSTTDLNIAQSSSPKSRSGKSVSNATPTDNTKSNTPTNKTDISNRQPQELNSTVENVNNNTLPIITNSEQSNANNPSNNKSSNLVNPGVSLVGEGQDAAISMVSSAGNWMTEPISSLDLKALETEETFPVAIFGITYNLVDSKQAKTLPLPAMSFGMTAGVNQSWLTMKNIPPTGDASLHDYDNSHPGFSMNAFVNKPFSPKFSWQAGLGYNVYNNKSILEDQFLLDMDNVTQMPDGQNMYQSDYNLVNPIGEYNMLLEFRVSDDMHENDVVVEYTTIEQTIQSVMLDLGVHYDLLTLNDFKISLGTGFGLGYRSGMKNEFNVSTYHNGILQKSQMETPDHLDNVKRWYGQWLGNINIGYYPTRRLGIILVTQYNAGITSIRDGGSANGPLTFLHAFSLSAGVTHTF